MVQTNTCIFKKKKLHWRENGLHPDRASVGVVQGELYHQAKEENRAKFQSHNQRKTDERAIVLKQLHHCG